MHIAFVCDENHEIFIEQLIKEGYCEEQLLDAPVYEIEDHPIEIQYAAGIIISDEGKMPDLLLIPNDTKNAEKFQQNLFGLTQVYVFNNR